MKAAVSCRSLCWDPGGNAAHTLSVRRTAHLCRVKAAPPAEVEAEAIFTSGFVLS